ncbi:efflux RND transporter permease subunit [bacterium]|nr:efflux RND transporter permease subunit [bacterium]
MTRLFKFFIDNWRFSALLTVLILIVGSVSLNLLRKESFPPVNFAVVSISTIYPGASPEEVHDKVTKEIEAELKGISGLKRVKSTSRSESSEIVVEIDIDTKNTKDIVSDIQKAVQRATSQLPKDLPEDPRIIEVKAEEIPVYEFALVGSNSNRARDILAEKIEDKLDDVKGVLDARVSGYAQKELQILVDPNKLKLNQISLNEMIVTLSAQLKNSPSGFIDNQKNISLVRVFGKKNNPEEISELSLRANDSGQSIKIKDVAQVSYGADRPKVISRFNGEEATLFVVTKKTEADTIKLVSDIENELTDLTKQLPADYSLKVYNNEGQRVVNRLNIVNFNAVVGIVVVLLVLFLFLPGKVGVFSALSLPICALATVTFMIWQGAQFNVITMIALVICLGNLVDNSVVISEYYTQLRENGEDAKKSALKAAKQFWIPFLASTITIISAFLPMIVTTGVMGQFIKWIPIIVTIALFTSLIESVTLLPARLQFLNPTKNLNKNNNWFYKLENFFASVIQKSIEVKWWTVSILGGFVISGFFVNGLFNRFELFPAEGVEYYIVRFELKTDSSIYNTDLVAKKINEMVMQKIPKEAIDSTITRVGVSQTDPSDPKSLVGENVGLIMVAIKPDWAPKLDIQKTLSELRTIKPFDDITKISFEPIENGPPVGKPLTLTFRSTEYETLSSLAESVLSEVKKIDGSIGTDSDEQTTGMEYRFIPDAQKISYSSVNSEALALNLATALKGTPVAVLNENGRKFDVVVQYDPKFISQVDYIKNIEVMNQFGQYVPVHRLGKFEQQQSPKTHKSYDYQRSITITSDIDVNKITASELNKKVKAIVDEKIKSYPDITAFFGGEEESTNESLGSLALALVIALFGIFATLVFTFKSFIKPFIILTTIPLGLVGVFYAFTLSQRPLSFLAFVGIVGLSGVVINSAIILVDYIEELIRTKKDLSLHEILILASKQRLRAVLATGLTTVVGLLPTAFGMGGYDPILVPITLSLSWGMIIGTVLTLVWVPSVYLILVKKNN